MKLDKIIDGLNCNISVGERAAKNPEIETIVYDSRKAKRDTIFTAIPGETVNGHRFISSAYEKGCRVFVISEECNMPEDVITIKVDDSRMALSKMSSNFFGNPSSEMKVIGVTGTKGKTTITGFLSQVMQAGGMKTGVIGTNGIFYNGKSVETANTTPESYELHKNFRAMADDGVDAVFMEVSSSGLMMHRVQDVDFDIAVFTNISPDHIGPKEHASFEDYLNCKAMLFSMADTAVINSDDNKAQDFIQAALSADAQLITFGFNGEPSYKAEKVDYSTSLDTLGSQFTLKDNLLKKEFKYISSSPGKFSIYNCLSVIAVARSLGMDHPSIIDAVKTAKVPGRVEVINQIPGSPIVLDYAHNGISLENILSTMKLYNPKRLICLFGSIGGRAILRREELALVAREYADISIITSDNPDNEDPDKIIDEIISYFGDYSGQLIRETDREKAIHIAVDLLKPGDLLVVAGKGHETYQLIHGEKVPFDEKGIILEAVEKKTNK